MGPTTGPFALWKLVRNVSVVSLRLAQKSEPVSICGLSFVVLPGTGHFDTANILVPVRGNAGRKRVTATLLYRIAASLLMLFAAAHTVGFLKFKPANADGEAVRNAMDNVRLQVGNGKLTYGDFYRGFGLFCSVYLLFAAYAAWYLADLARTYPQSIGTLGWAFCLLQIASLALSWKYFLPPPAVISAILVVCTGWAAWLL